MDRNALVAAARANGSFCVLDESVLPVLEFVLDSLRSEVWEGAKYDAGETSAEGSPRRRMLNIESLRDCVCGWGSVGVRESLDIGAGGGEAKSSAGAGPGETGDHSLWKGVGSCPCGPREVGGEASSGFAIRRPPNDWERLKSPSMTPRCKVCVAMAVAPS